MNSVLSMGLRSMAAPDSAMARSISPAVLGMVSSTLTLVPPADSPKMVTLSGSPPKAAMLSFTHCSAMAWSRKP